MAMMATLEAGQLETPSMPHWCRMQRIVFLVQAAVVCVCFAACWLHECTQIKPVFLKPVIKIEFSPFTECFHDILSKTPVISMRYSAQHKRTMRRSKTVIPRGGETRQAGVEGVEG